MGRGEEGRRKGVLGRLGEEAARRFLEERGYRILAVDFRMGRSQADLLAWEGGKPVVVEVKSTRGNRRPEANLSTTQAQRLLELGTRYFQGRGGPVRLDLVTVHFFRDSLPKVEVFPDLRILPRPWDG